MGNFKVQVINLTMGNIDCVGRRCIERSKTYDELSHDITTSKFCQERFDALRVPKQRRHRRMTRQLSTLSRLSSTSSCGRRNSSRRPPPLSITDTGIKLDREMLSKAFQEQLNREFEEESTYSRSRASPRNGELSSRS